MRRAAQTDELPEILVLGDQNSALRIGQCEQRLVRGAGYSWLADRTWCPGSIDALCSVREAAQKSSGNLTMRRGRQPVHAHARRLPTGRPGAGKPGQVRAALPGHRPRFVRKRRIREGGRSATTPYRTCLGSELTGDRTTHRQWPNSLAPGKIPDDPTHCCPIRRDRKGSTWPDGALVMRCDIQTFDFLFGLDAQAHGTVRRPLGN